LSEAHVVTIETGVLDREYGFFAVEIDFSTVGLFQ
jgi:hypothetical protein